MSGDVTPEVFRLLAADVRPQVDAEGLVFSLLSAAYPNDEWPDVTVMSEITMATNGFANSGYVIVFQCGSPSQVDRGLWSFPLTLQVIGNSGLPVHSLMSDVFRRVSGWMFDPPVAQGSVSRVTGFEGFHRQYEANENGSKDIVEYVADLTVWCRDSLVFEA